MFEPIEFLEKFKIKDLKVYESEYWIWSVRPQQVTLGSGILSLKRHCLSMSELNKSEFIDLYSIINVIENTLKQSFNYDILNYLMLMMVDKHVHYHIIPRYKDVVKFNGKEWVDKDWPGVPILQAEELPENKLKEIKSFLQSNIKCS